MLFAIVPEAPPTRKNQRATSCPAPISANVPYLPWSRLTCSAFWCVLTFSFFIAPTLLIARTAAREKFDLCQPFAVGGSRFVVTLSDDHVWPQRTTNHERIANNHLRSRPVDRYFAYERHGFPNRHPGGIGNSRRRIVHPARCQGPRFVCAWERKQPAQPAQSIRRRSFATRRHCDL